MSMELIRGLYDYHRWANRRLFDVTASLGAELAAREVGSQFSYPTLSRVVEYRNTEGKAFQLPLGLVLQHVANHATHHRSEIATMLTMVSGAPPDTGIATYEIVRRRQA